MQRLTIIHHTATPRYDITYTRPGCYKGFTHCHITEQGERCHNDTMICVCEDNLCNSEKYSSEAPPVTPGSGLFCYSSHHHRYCDNLLCVKREIITTLGEC